MKKMLNKFDSKNIRIGAYIGTIFTSFVLGLILLSGSKVIHLILSIWFIVICGLGLYNEFKNKRN